jgi:hypothetical protein
MYEHAFSKGKLIKQLVMSKYVGDGFFTSSGRHGASYHEESR